MLVPWGPDTDISSFHHLTRSIDIYWALTWSQVLQGHRGDRNKHPLSSCRSLCLVGARAGSLQAPGGEFGKLLGSHSESEAGFKTRQTPDPPPPPYLPPELLECPSAGTELVLKPGASWSQKQGSGSHSFAERGEGGQGAMRRTLGQDEGEASETLPSLWLPRLMSPWDCRPPGCTLVHPFSPNHPQGLSVAIACDMNLPLGFWLEIFCSLSLPSWSRFSEKY